MTDRPSSVPGFTALQWIAAANAAAQVADVPQPVTISSVGGTALEPAARLVCLPHGTHTAPFFTGRPGRLEPGMSTCSPVLILATQGVVLFQNAASTRYYGSLEATTQLTTGSAGLLARLFAVSGGAGCMATPV